MEKCRCYICSNHFASTKRVDQNDKYYYMHCENCGGYILPRLSPYLLFTNDQDMLIAKEKLSHYLFYNNRKKDLRTLFIGEKDEFSKFKKDEPFAPMKEIIRCVDSSQIDSWYPKNFAEKLNYALLKLSEKLKYDGDSLFLFYEEAKLIFFTVVPFDKINDDVPDRIEQIRYFLKALSELGYIEIISQEELDDLCINNPHIELSITPKGLDKIYELHNAQVFNKNVFVAMSFSRSTVGIRNAIKRGIKDAGYSPEIMDEIVHNHQIVPEMLRLISESKFVIMDITEPNFGAYYEAGYAQGLGKEVIITCRADIFSMRDFRCEYKTDDDKSCVFKTTARKPHFDIAQKQILIWEDYKDLTKKLSEWIKYIIG